MGCPSVDLLLVDCTKIHLATNYTGLSLSLCLSGGQAHESQYTETLLKRVGIIRKNRYIKSCPKAILADKVYPSKSLCYLLKIKGIKAVIPFKSNEKGSRDKRRKLNAGLYKKRNVVEHCL
ncbi:transposase [bacterium 19GA11TI05]|uniref:Transposase n=1 Tax=bacterium 19GA11TI05 TaxID=2920688 RepID=A0AAU6TXM5_UNCXX